MPEAEAPETPSPVAATQRPMNPPPPVVSSSLVVERGRNHTSDDFTPTFVEFVENEYGFPQQEAILTSFMGIPLSLLPSQFISLAHRDDLSGMQLSGNKVRKLEFLLANAVAQGADCVITIGAIQSNHCRATAAKYLNLDCYTILFISKDLVNQDPGFS